MHRHFFAKGLKALMCSLLCLSGVHISAVQVDAAESYQNDYTQKFPDTVTLDNAGGDKIQILNSLGTVTGDMTFEADVTLTDPNEEQSAALVFGITDDAIGDSTSIRANFHNKINWNVPARLWGYAVPDNKNTTTLTEDDWKAQGDQYLKNKGLDVTKTVHMKVAIVGDQVTFTMNNPGESEIVFNTATLTGYNGGRVGLMTYSSKAEFSNIKLNGKQYGTTEKDGNGFAINGLSDDAHAVNETAGKLEAFTYEADVDLTAGQSAALTFGIADPNNPGNDWFAANINGLESRIFHVNSSGATDLAKKIDNNGLDLRQSVHLKLDVESDGTVKYYYYNPSASDTEKNNPKMTGTLTDYSGGYLGALTFNSSANFHNVTITKKGSQGLTDFTAVNGAPLIIDDANKTVQVTQESGDHFAMYNGLENKANDFVFGATVELKTGASAALVFGANKKDMVPSSWNGANFDRNNGEKTFRVFGPGAADISIANPAAGIVFSQPINLKLDIKRDGSFDFTYGNVGQTPKVISGTVGDWNGGYIGILTCGADAVFSNISFLNRTKTDSADNNLSNDGSFKTNLTDLSYGNGNWSIQSDGLHSDAIGKGDSFLYTKTTAKNFVYSTDVTFEGEPTGAAALIFRSNQDSMNKEAYAVNIDGGSGEYKLWRWQNDEAYQLRDTGQKVSKPKNNKYQLKVVAYDGWISYYVNGQLVANTGDYTIQVGDLGQTTILKEGYLGLLNFNGKVVFQNTYYQELKGDFNPLLNGIKVVPNNGTVENPGQFNSTESVKMMYVSNEAATINLVPTKASAKATVKAYLNGKEYAGCKNIPLNVGKNIITVTSEVKDNATGRDAKVTYRLIVVRRLAGYYDEKYRDQYHYSVKEGWANDPNGLVYFNGKYHMFYQFYNDLAWGPMHWAHATSTDLVTWEDQPIAFYPDENGAMFSGCIVADEKNTSGLFDGIAGGGLVALITADGNGQRIKLAYSTDEGQTWKKTDKIVADFINDPLGSRDFRDPKVFRWENKWFMVIAGGPLRIYSSDNLIDWECESTYGDLHTECPDLYPIIASDNKLKWVLSRGGRYYKVGDFKQVSGKWTFVPDYQYSGNDTRNDGVMNFGRDSYAAMTYYVQDFGTVSSPTIPEIVELNWMNTWDNYCNQVAYQTNNNVFNGTFNLHLKLGLRLKNGKYELTQTPIDGYKTLRETAKEWKNKEIKAGVGDNLDGFKGSSYEIVANMKPQAGTSAVGFKVRKNGSEETVVKYDLNTKRISIDRSKSGKIITNGADLFSVVNEMVTERKDDGSVDLHIFVDRASVEVFMNDYTAAGANQIFPNTGSDGIEVFSEGGNTIADITIYPLKSIWKDAVTVPVLELDESEVNASVNETFTLNASIYPETEAQDVMWSVDHPELLKITKAGATTAEFTTLKEGTVTITATSKHNPTVKAECKVTIRRNDFKTNLKGFAMSTRGWTMSGDAYVGSVGADNVFTFAESPIQSNVYTYSADIKLTKGLFNMIFETQPNSYDGSYALQLGGNSNLVRLFDFKGDVSFIREENGMPAGSSSADCHIDIVKDGNRLIVYIDGKKAVDYTVNDPDRQYETSRFGFGLWDGNVEVRNVYVRAGYPSKTILSTVDDVTITDLQAAEDALALLPTSVRVADLNGDEIAPQSITWDLSKVPFGTAGTYTVTGTAESGLQTTAKIIIVVDKQALEKAIQKAESLNEDDYEAESWKELTQALEEAKLVLSDPNADGKTVQATTKKLNDIMDNMIRKNNVVVDQNGNGEVRGDLKSGAILIIENMLDQVQSLISSQALKYYNVHGLYEATLYVNGVEYQPDGTIQLRLNLPKERAQRNYILARVVNGQLLIMTDSRIEDGQIVVNVDELGTFAIVSIKENSSNNDLTSNGVNTGDSTQPFAMTSWMLISGFALYLVMKKRQVSNNN